MKFNVNECKELGWFWGVFGVGALSLLMIPLCVLAWFITVIEEVR